VLGAALVLAAGLAPAAARELHWSALVSEATLESDGTLRVVELQRMVFTGDWNGGERSFRLSAGQELTLDRIARIDPATGVERELARGDLDQVDRWEWASSSAVRWRSRRPEDPEFERTPIDYRLEYRLTGVLKERGGGRYTLDHDFAFAEREGVIERVVVRLALGSGWRATSPHPESWQAEMLPSGQGFVVPLELEFTGPELPALASPVRLPPLARWAALALFVGGVLYFLTCLVWRERALGRFGGGRPAPVDRAWLDAHVFALAPEVVGAAWDRSVGSAEVAALLARLTAEGKLAAEVKSSGKWIFRRDDLHLRLLAGRGELNEYERALIDALFGGAETTDTRALRERYRSTGFDPASKIRAGVEAKLGLVRGFAAGSPKPAWQPTALLIVGGALTLVAALVLHRQARGETVAALLLMLPPWCFLGLAPALAGQKRIRGFAPTLIAMLLSMALLGGVLWGLAWWPGTGWLHVAGALLVALGLARATFNFFATRESAESLARRRELLRAREHFARELRQSEPRLEDRWYPYLLAFGLAPQVDRWFQRFGAAASGGIRGSSPAGGLGGGSGSGGGWSGGGGAFGGAGASASFAAAATAMSAGVAKPGSSGGGGGGGGGSSGGGGGGGW